MTDFSGYSTVELVEQIKANKESPALTEMIRRYEGYIRSLFWRMNIHESEQPDFISDAYIRLYKAAVSFDAAKNIPFDPYAKLCIRRAFFSRMKRKKSESNRCYANCVYIDDSDSPSDKALELYCEYADPQSEYIRAEEYREFMKKAKALLTDFEWEVLSLYTDDLSYSRIAEKVGKNVKSVSNAVYRIRNKLSVINYLK